MTISFSCSLQDAHPLEAKFWVKEVYSHGFARCRANPLPRPVSHWVRQALRLFAVTGAIAPVDQ